MWVERKPQDSLNYGGRSARGVPSFCNKWVPYSLSLLSASRVTQFYVAPRSVLRGPLGRGRHIYALHRTLSFCNSLPPHASLGIWGLLQTRLSPSGNYWHFGLHNSLLWWGGGYSVHSRIFSSIAGLYPLDASSILPAVTIKNVFQMSPGRQNCSYLRTIVFEG